VAIGNEVRKLMHSITTTLLIVGLGYGLAAESLERIQKDVSANAV